MVKGGDGRTDVSKFPPVFYRTSALWGRCPKSVRLPPPIGHQDLKSALQALNLAFEASNQPSRLIISPLSLKSALQTSNLPSRPSISL